MSLQGYNNLSFSFILYVSILKNTFNVAQIEEEDSVNNSVRFIARHKWSVKHRTVKMFINGQNLLNIKDKSRANTRGVFYNFL